MSVLDSYMKDLAELVNKDRGTANIAGVTEAAKIMKGHLESIGFKADLIDLGPNAGNGLFATNKPNADHYDVSSMLTSTPFSLTELLLLVL